MLNIIKIGLEGGENKYQLANIKIKNELKIESEKCDIKKLSFKLEEELKKSKTDYTKYGDELKKFLVNIMIKNGEFVTDSLSISIGDSLDESPDTELAFNAIDVLCNLICMKGSIRFTHNSKKIVSKSGYDSTSYFKDSEPVFLNKIIYKKFSDMIVKDNSVIVEYDIDGVDYYFELINVTSESIKLGEFEIVMSMMDFEGIEDKSVFSQVIQSNDKVIFSISSEKLGRVNYDIPEYCISLISNLMNRKNVLRIIRDSFSLFSSINNIDSFLSKFEEKGRIGVRLTNNGVRWKTSDSLKSIFDLKYIDNNREKLKEFIAMLEISPYDEFFINSGKFNKELVKLCFRLYEQNKYPDLEEVEKDIKLIDLYIMKLMSEKLKSDGSYYTLWISTDYGQEIIGMEDNSYE